jgi:hypothetical protein
MSLLAKAIVKNKCWVVEEDNGKKIGTILATPRGVVFSIIKNESNLPV